MKRSERRNPLIAEQVLPKFFITLLLTFIAMYLGSLFIPESIALVCAMIPLVVLIVLLFKAIFSSSKKKSRKKLSTYGMKLPMWLVYLFVILMGIGMYPAIKMYVSEIGANLVILAFAATAAIFGGLFLYTYFTKRDFSGIGGFLFGALLALIVLGIGNYFLGSSMLELALAFAGVLVFSGYMLYDVSRMKHESFSKEDVPAAVFDLYLNFINIFLDILRIIHALRK